MGVIRDGRNIIEVAKVYESCARASVRGLVVMKQVASARSPTGNTARGRRRTI
jgi:hypothetical protein